jgi:polyisoprenoid-binding protein YceI
MYMKKAFFAIAGIAFLTAMYSFAPRTENKPVTTLTVNTEKSRVDWVASKKTDFHTGSFAIKSGQIQVEDGKLKGGKFVLDLANLKVTDAGGGDRLAGHLKSPEFFDAAKFGEATYEITDVTYTSANAADITGNLTVKGTTVPIKIQALIRNSDEKGFFAQAFLSLDRTLIGINYGAGMVSNDVELAVHVFAK